ncbi:peptidoglycan-associated lipoprotein Pal [Marinospirillum perlucidum]|uniref:peptidoglycan-associated lipoprotein Pal n=1 Tax=Marinospirillum perlucidum TaxID=1982602 RepID=UPI000DF36716|nr:peptidoglycan-associated lipoprotein Pal [Marinospirillum perlucidum]
MDLMKYSKPFALAAVLALVAGCGGSGGTQPADETEDEVTAEEVQTSDGAETSAAGEESGANAEAMGEDAMDAMRPEVMTIYFDFDKSNIRSEFYDVLNGHAAYLQANPDAQVVLEGHADERGTREYNMALGERRGNSVQRYLSLQGVSADQMEVVSYGEERPVVRAADTAEEHAKNRRVEFVY